MDIVLEFRSSPPGARPIWLTVKTKDGRVLELDWDDSMISCYKNKASFSAFGLICADDGGYRPEPDDFDGAILIDASWRDDDENAFGGSIEILSAIVKNDDGEYPLLGTPLSLPRAIDYDKIDWSVRDAVRYFNAAGLRTEKSYGGEGIMRVVFHRSVTEMDLRLFPGGQPKLGRFCILLEPDMKHSFAYVADLPESVQCDLAAWRQKFPGGGHKDHAK